MSVGRIMTLRRVFILALIVWLAAACKPASSARSVTSTQMQKPESTSPASVASARPSQTDTPVIPRSTKPPNTPAPMVITLPPSPTADLLACLPNIPGYTGMVSWVIDGETVVIDIGGRLETVRLLGIDALPLTKEITSSLLDRQVVRLLPDRVSRDTNGRYLRYVLYLDGRFINDELLRSGAARLDAEAGNLKCGAQFASAEDFAIQEGLGIWTITPVAALPTELQPTGSASQPAVSPVPAATPSATPSLTPATIATITPATQPAATSTQGIPTNTEPPTVTRQPPAVATSTPTNTQPAPTGTVQATGVQIVSIFYDGALDPYEPDEYVEIKNFENTAVNITDWWIFADSEAEFFFFPNFTLQPGQSCRVYSNEVQADSCVDDSFRSYLEVWNNVADCGYLYDGDFNERSSFCYGEVP